MVNSTLVLVLNTRKKFSLQPYFILDINWKHNQENQRLEEKHTAPIRLLNLFGLS